MTSPKSMNTKYRFHILQSVLALAVAVVLFGCATEAEEEPSPDDSFITGQPCVAPCWYGLELDQSSIEDALDTLKRLSFVDQSMIREWGGYGKDRNITLIPFYCENSSNHWCGELMFTDRKLNRITLRAPKALTIKTIVDKLGTPDYITYRPYAPDATGCFLFIYWPDKTISASRLDRSKNCPYKEQDRKMGIDSNQVIEDLTYSSKGLFKVGEPEKIRWPGFAK